LKSAFSQPGRFSLQEPVVHSIAQWVLDRVVGAGPSANTKGYGRY
jgi:hypothetical protein